ncbi:MAG: phosphoglucosamine mutase [Bacilli bacterium]|nr:phosphoglucosamine mutase [Bacilli bacterium]
MGKLFGTDGARGIVGTELDVNLALKIGASTARVLKNDKEKLTFLIASDTRISKDILKFALTSGVLSENANIIDLGVIPTPAISYLIKKYKADGGFVISASHNPSEYNGIKVFNSEGYKLADELEEKIEDIILNDFQLTKEVNKVGTYEIAKNAKEDYVEYLRSTVNSDFNKLNIGVDTANGAAYETADMLFKLLGINYHIINNNPDGLNINDNAGSTHLEGLQKYVVDNKLDCGVAFDGDADRCLLIDELGNVVDGDKIMAIYGDYLMAQNKLKNNTLVGTVMSNLGFVKFCEKNNINFIATKVGDRYVLENMLENDYIVGGEQSGHIIFREFANTGDGELTAIQILNIMAKSGKKLSELASIMETYPQVLKNVNVSKEGKETYQENKVINDYIKNVEKDLNGEGRVLVRASGTENLIRVMLEGKDIDSITKLCDDIVEIIKKELN